MVEALAQTAGLAALSDGDFTGFLCSEESTKALDDSHQEDHLEAQRGRMSRMAGRASGVASVNDEVLARRT